MGSACSHAEAQTQSEEESSEDGSQDSLSEDGRREVTEEVAEEVQPTKGLMGRLRELIEKIGGAGKKFVSAKELKVHRGVTLATPPKVLIKENHNKKIDEHFEMDTEIGTGGYGTVHKAKDKRTGSVRALKCMLKGAVKDTEMFRLRREIDIMLALDHPNIVKLFQVFEDCRCIYLVLELCQGGELFDIIQSRGFLSEPDSACIMQQILRAVHYMHQNGVCHRDLKPENFLFLNKSSSIAENPLKVIDFGLAHEFRKGQNQKCGFSTQAGTLYYVAPEVLKGEAYGPACDYWSCGVMLYVLISGLLPFKKKSEAETTMKVMSGKFTFPEKRFGNVSNEAKDLITRLLKLNPKERCTAEEALADSWTESQAPRATRVSINQSVVSSMRSFNVANKLKKAALNVAARQVDFAKVEELRNIFLALDKNGNGSINGAELAEGLKTANLDTSDLEEIVNGLDSDNSGEVDYTEFLAASMNARQNFMESHCWAAFRVFDLNDDGAISPEELKAVLSSQGSSICNKNIEEIMEEVDTNKDGQIDFPEFMNMLQGPPPAKTGGGMFS
jgi:calcium-dependent protein kinase